MTYCKKLIEVALPLIDISEGGAREQSIKRGKPTQIHKWFAGRPMVTCRAVLWASLIDDPSAHPDKFPTAESQNVERARLFEILTQISDWDLSKDAVVIRRAQDELRRQYGTDLPLIVDPFSGGGTLPLEALRLGLNSISADLNPVAVLVQRALVEIPYRFMGSASVHPGNTVSQSKDRLEGFASDVENYGRDVVELVEASHGHLYPTVSTPDGRVLNVVAWIWARTVPSPDPGFRGRVPLVDSWLLMDDKRRGTAWIHAEVDSEPQEVIYQIRNTGEPPAGTMRGRGNAVCVATGASISAEYIKECAERGDLGEDLIAVIADGRPGRIACAPTQEQLACALLPDVPDWKPEGLMSSHPQYMGPPRYGIREWWQIFTKRQLSTNVALATAVREIQKTIEKDALAAGMSSDKTPLSQGGSGALAYSEAIQVLLACVVDRVTDWNNSSCYWDDKNLVNYCLFTMQAVRMMWDFCEINPLTEGAGSFPSSLKTIATALRALPTDRVGSVTVGQADAAETTNRLASVVVSTDPPYYDAVPYADISDFYYPWLKYMVGSVYPNDYATVATPKHEELVADAQRWGNKESARKHFEGGMSTFMSAVAGAQHRDIPATIFYAYKATEVRKGKSGASGWDTFLQSIVDAKMMITSTWPVRTENRSRMRAQGSNVLATSVVLSCRRRPEDAGVTTLADYVSELRRELPAAIKLFETAGIPAVDLEQAALGPGIAIFSRYDKVFSADGEPMSVRQALGHINDILSEIQSGEDTDFDSYTRFAVTLFDSHGHDDVLFGVADALAQAKNITPDMIVNSGIAKKGGGKFRLLRREELVGKWSPTSDTTVTVWEATQYLIRALEQSELDAARLLKQLGGFGVAARQLAYMLYGICNKRNRADDAVKYNMLVTAWPQIQRLATQGEQATGEKGMFE